MSSRERKKKSSDKLGKDKQTRLSRSSINCCLDHRTLMQLGVEVGAPAPRMFVMQWNAVCVEYVCVGSL